MKQVLGPKAREEESSFFCGKSIGKNIKEISVDLVETENEAVISRWYHGPSADLFTWVSRKGDRIIKQQINFNGQVVEWNSRDGLKTGVTIESDLSKTYNSEGKLEKEGSLSQSIKFDDLPMSNCVALAVEILENAPLENHILEKLLGNFKTPGLLRRFSLRKIIK